MVDQQSGSDDVIVSIDSFVYLVATYMYTVYIYIYIYPKHG